MRWFGGVVPLLSLGKKTEKQPVYVSTLKSLITLEIISLFFGTNASNILLKL